MKTNESRINALNLKWMKYESYENRGEGWQYYHAPESAENIVSMGDFKPCKEKSAFFEFPFTAWGDYCGSTVEHANYNEMMESFKDNPALYDIRGGYNSHSIVCHVDILQDEDILDILEGLQDYPLINDESHSNLEFDLQRESWDAWIKSDLKHKLDELEIEYPNDDDKLEQMFWQWVRYNDIEFYCEDAVSATIPSREWESLAETWDNWHCKSCNGDLNYSGENCPNCPRLF